MRLIITWAEGRRACAATAITFPPPRAAVRGVHFRRLRVALAQCRAEATRERESDSRYSLMQAARRPEAGNRVLPRGFFSPAGNASDTFDRSLRWKSEQRASCGRGARLYGGKKNICACAAVEVANMACASRP